MMVSVHAPPATAGGVREKAVGPLTLLDVVPYRTPPLPMATPDGPQPSSPPAKVWSMVSVQGLPGVGGGASEKTKPQPYGEYGSEDG